jgi:hypothetical protein
MRKRKAVRIMVIKGVAIRRRMEAMARVRKRRTRQAVKFAAKSP